MEMKLISLDYSNMMEPNLGQRFGLSEADLTALQPPAAKVHQSLRRQRDEGVLRFYDLPFRRNNLEDLQNFGAEARAKFENFVLLGIGGSALGPYALFRALKHTHHNLLPANRRNAPRFFVCDNVDPVEISALAGLLDPAKTLFNVITKSGTTAETMSGFMFFFRHLKARLGDRFKDHLVFTTDPEKGFLRQLANDWQVPTFDIPPEVGGRFSILTPVGLLPAAVLNVNLTELLDGAAAMEPLCTRENILENPAYTFAALHYLAYRKQKRNIAVMMPYAGALYSLADWFRQLWAESLGKQFDLSNARVEVGQTPVKALGTTDQHSQIQLYVEGPHDKLVTFLEVEKFAAEGKIEGDLGIAELDYLRGKSLEQLITGEKQATELALTATERPNMTLKIPEVNAAAMGQLFYLFEVATAFAGGLLHINPFDQPGVEAGKIATYALMGRKGYEAQRRKIEARLNSRQKFICP